MRVSYISESLIPSHWANSVHVMKMCQALSKKGFGVFLFAIMPKSDYLVSRKIELHDHYGVKENISLTRLIKLPEYLNGRNIYAFICVLLSKLLNVDLIVTRHTLVPYWAEIFQIRYIVELHELTLFDDYLLTCKRFHFLKKIVFITKNLKNETYARHKILRSINYVVSPDSVDLERFRKISKLKQSKERLGIPNKFTVCYVGSLYEGRGIRFIIDLAKTLVEYSFIIVGGPNSDVVTWRKVIAKESVENVTLTGFVPNSRVPHYLISSDVLIMPYENTHNLRTKNWCSPMKMFEYMAAGKPIVSSSLFVLKEILVDGRNVIFADSLNVLEWQKIIKNLENNNELVRQMGSNNLKDVENYTWDNRVSTIVRPFNLSDT